MEGQSLGASEGADRATYLSEKFGDLPTMEEYEELQNLNGDEYLLILQLRGHLFSACYQLADGQSRSLVFYRLSESISDWDEAKQVMIAAMDWAMSNNVNFENESEEDKEEFHIAFQLDQHPDKTRLPYQINLHKAPERTTDTFQFNDLQTAELTDPTATPASTVDAVDADRNTSGIISTIRGWLGLPN